MLPVIKTLPDSETNRSTSPFSIKTQFSISAREFVTAIAPNPLPPIKVQFDAKRGPSVEIPNQVKNSVKRIHKIKGKSFQQANQDGAGT